MPTKDYRARTIIDNGKDQGRRVVHYHTAAGKRVSADIIGPGGSSGLKLMVRMGATHVIVDNVPQKTTAGQKTNVYSYRTQ